MTNITGAPVELDMLPDGSVGSSSSGAGSIVVPAAHQQDKEERTTETTPQSSTNPIMPLQPPVTENPMMSGLGNWIGAIAGAGAFLVAIYYGSRSLQLQRWSAQNDFRGSCIQLKTYSNTSSKACEAILGANPLPPPSMLKMFAERALSCLTFRDGCSREYNLGSIKLQKRSLKHASDSRFGDWIPFGIYILVGIVLGGVSRAAEQFIRGMEGGTAFLNRFHASLIDLISWYFHETTCGSMIRSFLQQMPWFTHQLLLALSCFSPLYAMIFWLSVVQSQESTTTRRRNQQLPAGVWLTVWGGVVCMIYVYTWKRARTLEQEIEEQERNTDLNRLENQLWKQLEDCQDSNGTECVTLLSSRELGSTTVTRRRVSDTGSERL